MRIAKNHNVVKSNMETVLISFFLFHSYQITVHTTSGTVIINALYVISNITVVSIDQILLFISYNLAAYRYQKHLIHHSKSNQLYWQSISSEVKKVEMEFRVPPVKLCLIAFHGREKTQQSPKFFFISCDVSNDSLHPASQKSCRVADGMMTEIQPSYCSQFFYRW